MSLTYNPNIDIEPMQDSPSDNHSDYNRGRTAPRNKMLRSNKKNNRNTDSYYEPPQPVRRKYNKKYIEDTSDDEIEEPSSKINWIKIAKMVSIYTILFLIISSQKVHDFMCEFIPYLSTNELGCRTLEGIIFGITIVILHKLLN
jgi:hypothetical protein